MSTGSECYFKRFPTGWFYVLENLYAPKNAWDWREYARAHGPFDSLAAAQQDLRDNHANPGGYWTPQGEGDAEVEEPDDVERALIAKAYAPRRRSRWI